MSKVIVAQTPFLKRIIDGLPVALFCKDYADNKGTFVLWNSQASLFWGLKESEVIGKTDYDIFPKQQADFFRAKDLETLGNGKTVFIKEEEANSFAGKKTSVRTWKITLNEDGKPRYLLGISQNIEDIKVLESELLRHQKHLLEAYHIERTAQVARKVAHDVNNPLAVILGRSNQIKRGLQRQSPTDEIIELVNVSIDEVKEAALRIRFLTEVLEKIPDQSVSLKEGSPESFRPGDSDFQHELLNLLAPISGQASLALNKIRKGAGEHILKEIEERLVSVQDSAKRIEQFLREKKKGRAR